MQFGPVKIFFICLGAASVLYFLYYFFVPIFVSGYWLNHHYSKSKYEDGFFWVKLKRTDKDYFVYKIEVKGLRPRDVCWHMLDQHKKAYKLYIGGRDDGATSKND